MLLFHPTKSAEYKSSGIDLEGWVVVTPATRPASTKSVREFDAATRDRLKATIQLSQVMKHGRPMRWNTVSAAASSAICIVPKILQGRDHCGRSCLW